MSEENKLDIHRIQSLTDSTFAVAMTLLILEIKIPSGLDKLSLLNYFTSHTLSDLLIYVIGFISLGIFWIASHFHHNIISKTDKISSWLNIAFLMVVCIIPFSISLLKNYTNDQFSIIFHCVILITAGILNLLMLHYAWYKKHTKEFYSIMHFKFARIKILIPIFIYILIIIVSIFSLRLSILLFFAPLLMQLLPESYMSKK